MFARSSKARPSAILPLLLALAVAVTCWACVGEVRAQTPLAVVGVHGSGQQLNKDLAVITGELVAGFEQSGRFDVRHGRALHSNFAYERAAILQNVFLGGAQQQLEAGKNLYEHAKPDLAVDQLMKGIQALEADVEFLRDRRLAVELNLQLGLTLASLGRVSEARAAFSKVVTLDPKRELDEMLYPPKVVGLYQDVRARLIDQDPATLVFSAGGSSDVSVYLDGHLVGVVDGAPLEVAGVVPGSHWISAEAPSLGRFFTTLRVDADETAQMEINLEKLGMKRDGKDSLQSDGSSLTRRLYKEISVAAGADLVVMAAFENESDLQLAFYSARDDQFSVILRASLNAAPGDRAQFLADLARRLVVYVDEQGAIKSGRRSREMIRLRLGSNPILNSYLFGPKAVKGGKGKGKADGGVANRGKGDKGNKGDKPSTEKKKLPLPALIAIIGGAIGGVVVGAIVIGAAAQPPGTPTGTLVIRIP